MQSSNDYMLPCNVYEKANSICFPMYYCSYISERKLYNATKFFAIIKQVRTTSLNGNSRAGTMDKRKCNRKIFTGYFYQSIYDGLKWTYFFAQANTNITFVRKKVNAQAISSAQCLRSIKRTCSANHKWRSINGWISMYKW